MNFLISRIAVVTVLMGTPSFASAESLKQLATETHYHGIAFAQSGSAILLLASHHGVFSVDSKGNVITANGTKLGIAKKNGAYYDNKGVNVLNTKDMDKENCAILDPQGHNFGTAHKNYKLHACAAHCFFLAQAKEKAEKKP